MTDDLRWFLRTGRLLYRCSFSKKVFIRSCGTVGKLVAVMSSAVKSGAPARLEALRAKMKESDLNVYIVPTADRHQSEYISKADAHREWLSGFTGSAGTAVVTETNAFLWTDGRYVLQAKQQLDHNCWELMDESLTTTPSRPDYLADTFRNQGIKVGLSASVITNRDFTKLSQTLQRSNIKLVAVEHELVASVRSELNENPPPLPCNPIRALSMKYAGKSIEDKLQEVRHKMESKGVSALVVSALDSIAWLLNCRGSDIQYNPVFYAYLYITNDEIVFFDQPKRIEESVQAISKAGFPRIDLTTDCYENILTFLRSSSVALANDWRTESKPTVWVPHNYSQSLHDAASADGKVHIFSDPSPVYVMKVSKNATEAQGLRNCHVRDGAALVRFFHHMEKFFETNSKTLSETEAARLCDNFRSHEDEYIGPSFDTISSAGPNGSIIHYKPKEGADRQVTNKELYLVDSGGQYTDGTTDVTRTVHFGTPNEEEKRHFTLVLKGQISLSCALFPQGMKGNVLDILARHPLWQEGLDYAHGTGHGVGHQLNVHEGPIGITFRDMPDDPGLGPGMFLSNEPGFYLENKYGIRIEDVIETVTARAPLSGSGTRIDGRPGKIGDFGGRGALSFRTVTLVPIQLKMIDLLLLNDKEIKYIDSYHERVCSEVGQHLKSNGFDNVAEWLAKETIPLQQYNATCKR